MRRKERRFGIWVNTETVTVRQAPSFYAIATTRPLDELLTETERLRYGIGMDQAVRRIGGTMIATRRLHRGADPAQAGGRQLRAAERRGEGHRGDAVPDRIEMPANLVEGDYAAEFFLVRDREVISSGATIITVEKAGIERWLYNLSRDEPLIYGLMSVALALAAGWLAAAAFRLARW